MHYTDRHRIQGLLMVIDFESAFDTRKFIYKTHDNSDSIIFRGAVDKVHDLIFNISFYHARRFFGILIRHNRDIRGISIRWNRI